MAGTILPEDDERSRRWSDGHSMLDKLVMIVSTLAVLAATIVIILGAVYAFLENEYQASDYLEDLKALVLGLAAVLIAMELPNAIHRRMDREDRRRNSRHRSDRYG